MTAPYEPAQSKAISQGDAVSQNDAIPRSDATPRADAVPGTAASSRVDAAPRAAATPRAEAVGAAMALGTAFFLSVNNVAQGFYYAAGGTVTALVIVRFAVYILACLALFPLIGKRRQLAIGDLKGGLGSGLVYVCGMLALLFSFQFIAISLAILALYTFPIFTALGASLLDRRPPGWAQCACLVVAFLGLALALDIGGAGFDLRGLGLASTAALCFAITFLWNERLVPERDPVVTTYHMSITGLFVTLGLIASTGAPPMVWPGDAPFPGMAAAIASYSLAFLLMYLGLARIGASPTAMIMNLEPVFTMALGFALLGERLAGHQFLGAGLVLGAVLLSQWQRRRTAAPPLASDAGDTANGTGATEPTGATNATGATGTAQASAASAGKTDTAATAARLLRRPPRAP